MGLYPTFDIPSGANENTSTGRQYKQSVSFDFEKGDLATNTNGKIIRSSKRDAWIDWCIKVCQTQKGAFMAYSSKIGVDFESTIAADIQRQEALLEKEITDTLLADPYKRTESVRNFSFVREGDGLLVTFDVYGANDDQETLQINY